MVRQLILGIFTNPRFLSGNSDQKKEDLKEADKIMVDAATTDATKEEIKSDATNATTQSEDDDKKAVETKKEEGTTFNYSSNDQIPPNSGSIFSFPKPVSSLSLFSPLSALLSSQFNCLP